MQGPYTASFNNTWQKIYNMSAKRPPYFNESRAALGLRTGEESLFERAPALRQAMTRNPTLRVFVANGYYDLATPYLATRYTFNHLDLDGDLRNRVRMTYYTPGT